MSFIQRSRTVQSHRSKGGKLSIIDWLFISALIVLSAQGVLNFVFRGTPLVVWKQLLLIALIPIAFIMLFRCRHLTTLFAAIILPITIIIASHFNGVSSANILQNLLYYIAWLPFFVYGRLCLGSNDIDKVSRPALIFMLVSGVGMVIQLTTPFLDFLNDNVAALQYQTMYGEARRLSLYFVSSTLVMPTLAGMYCLYSLRRKISAPAAFLPLPFLVAAAIPTGSVSAAIVLLGCFSMALCTQAHANVKSLFIFVFSGLILYGLLQISLDSASGVVLTQLERVLGNDQYSDSNRGRVALWEEAIRIISQFNLAEHFSGKGLGLTNAARIAEQKLIHGESSFLQAYLEGGVVGLALRLAPFALILAQPPRARYRLVTSVYALFVLVACAVAPTFGAFGVQCTLGLVAGVVRGPAGRS